MSADPSGRPVSWANASTYRTFHSEVRACATVSIDAFASMPTTSRALSDQTRVERPVPLPRSTTQRSGSPPAYRESASRSTSGGCGRLEL
jgi:hypothetical protein